jgi:hypothetical protein
LGDDAIWKAIEEGPEDAFQVEIHSYHQFLVLQRVKRTWWRRLLWAPWRSHRLVEIHSGEPPTLQITKRNHDGD